jgi:hypothetical protein
MTTEELIRQAEALSQRIQPYGQYTEGFSKAEGAKAQVCEFLRTYAGPKSAFLTEAEAARGHDKYLVTILTHVLKSYVEVLKAGLATGSSPETKAQLDVMSDLLGQAQTLIEQAGVHPATPIMLIGATLEEFLRTWVEREGLSIGTSKPGIDVYSRTLLSANLINKQDIKDITSWAGLRNSAAHGQWDEVKDRQRASVMLESVNLFMRKYTP